MLKAARTKALTERRHLPIKASLSKELSTLWADRWLYFLILPSLILVFVFRYLPIYGVTLAFRFYDPGRGVFGSPWAQPITYNFWFLQDPEFWRVLMNTLRITSAKIIFGFPAPIILAILLNELRGHAYRRVAQTVTYLPHFVSWVILAGIIYAIFDLEPGSPFNVLRGVIGLEPTNLLGNPDAFVPVVVVSDILRNMGYSSIIYLAAIAGINPELYEAAVVDGARRWKQTWHVTVPCILPTISVLFILLLPGILYAGLDQIYNLMNPATLKVANVTDIYVLRVGLLQGQYAYATALGLVFGAVQLSLVFVANGLTRRSTGYGLW